MIRKADIARHWGCKPCYLSWLTRNKAMPPFASLEEADAWRAHNAPPRVLRITTPPPPVAGKKIAVSEPPPETHPIPPAPSAAAQVSTVDTSLPAAVPDIPADADITRIYLAQAREVVAAAYALYLRAVAGGSAAEVANALANWSAAVKATQAIEESGHAQIEKSGGFIPVPVCKDINLTMHWAQTQRLLKFGERVCSRANPENPNLAKNVIDEAMREVFRMLSADLAHGFSEIKERAAAAAAAA